MASSHSYRVMTDLIIWFGQWDDAIEKLGDNLVAAEDLRVSTKNFISIALGLAEDNEAGLTTNPLIGGFQPIAAEARAFYNEGKSNPHRTSYNIKTKEKVTLTVNVRLDQRIILFGHFEQYIDATRLEAEAEQSTEIPSLQKYWEVRILTSGMGTLLGLSEYALQVQLPSDFVQSKAYSTLWVTAVVINSMYVYPNPLFSALLTRLLI